MKAKLLTIDEVLDRLRREISKYTSQVDWAKANKVHPPRVSEVLAKRRRPEARLLKALGLKEVERMYREK
jgi:hypothetical protein